MKKGFTMIELIFVIVILGILAAVAIPNLTATRDDAKIAKGATDVATAIQDVSAFYTAKGRMDEALTDMTNVTMLGHVGSNDCNTATAYCNYEYNVSTTVSCVEINVSGDGNISVGPRNATNGAVCTGILNRTQDMQKVHVVGGSSVEY